MKILSLCIISMLLAMTNLDANPSIYGPTGLIEMPTAESIAYKQVNFAIDYSMQNDKDSNDKDNIELYLNETPTRPHFNTPSVFPIFWCISTN